MSALTSVTSQAERGSWSVPVAPVWLLNCLVLGVSAGLVYKGGKELEFAIANPADPDLFLGSLPELVIGSAVILGTFVYWLSQRVNK